MEETKSRWERVKRIVDAALDLRGADGRARYLDEACGSDAALRHEVEVLLQHENDSFLERSPAVELEATFTATAVPSVANGTPGSDARFPPGAVLAGRYRIVERVGRGGMGEVYHAEDLSLEQDVALKFLSPDTAGNQYARARLRHEVRTARQISHPNVCRLHDLTEIDDLAFITMEFIRGEDLQSLLRRIGNLPPVRATEVAVQLVSGLAAAHRQGVLHRDLKPANIMLDDCGHVRITDFGLAAIAGEVESRDIRSGTPAYMAPEQKRGESVTERSDLYSFGLVLYELLTGAHPFSEPPGPDGELLPVPPSSLASGIDPTVEKVVLQCLEPDPSRRPESADVVQFQLPGGDRLEAAVARGETPARALVAEARTSDGLSARVASIGLLYFVLALGASIWLSSHSRLSALVPLPKSPAVLVADSRRSLEALGYDNAPRDFTYGFSRDCRYIDSLLEQERSPDWWQRLTRGDPGVVRFWYRESDEFLVPRRQTEFFPTELDPPLSTPGMLQLRLDTRGRLRFLHALPSSSGAPAVGTSEPSWEPLFELAAFDPSLFERAPGPRALSADAVTAAWRGVYPEAPEIPIRVEATAVDGRITEFAIFEPWDDQETRSEEALPRRSDVVPHEWARVAHVGANVLLILGLSWLAWRNLRSGRGDRQLAVRLALILSGLVFLQWFLAAHHVPEISQLQILEGGLYRACYVFVLAALLYLALEPYARKLWPRALVSWVRLLSGRVNDPIVGRDILVGSIAGVSMAAVSKGLLLLPVWIGGIPRRPDFPQHPAELLVLRGVREAVAELLAVQVNIVTHVMFLFIALLLFRLVFRRTGIAVAVHWLLYVAVYGSAYGYVSIAVFITVWHILFFRFGWLAILTSSFVTDLLVGFPLTTHLSAWYAYGTILAGAACVLIAAYGFKTSLAGRPVFRDLLDDP